MMTRNLIVASSVALLVSPVSAAELIVNGGFETGDFAGWTRTGALGNTSVTAVAANAGDFGASFSPNQIGSLAQDLATQTGKFYTISFDLAHTASQSTPINSFSFSFDFAGTTIQSFSGFNATPYTTISVVRAATGPVSTLQFNFRDARVSAFYLDNVSVTGPIPEPATWAMMIGGLGLVGAALRRRRVVPAA